MIGAKELIEELEWTRHPLRKEPWKLAVVVFLALGAGVVGAIGLQSGLYGVVAFAIVMLSTAEFWLGSRFRLDSKGASVKTGISVQRIEWNQVQTVEIQKDWIKLSPLEIGSRLSPFRGVTILAGESNRLEIEEWIAEHVGPDTRFVGSGADSAGAGRVGGIDGAGSFEAEDGNGCDSIPRNA
jgi:hypothetical protein